MKKALFLCLFATVVTLAVLQARGATVTIKLATLAPDGSNWHEHLKDLAERWKEVSGGQVRLRIYAGGVAGDDMDVMRKIRIGQLSAAAITPQGLSSISKATRVFSIPRMIRSYDELDYAMEQMAPRLEAILAERGFIVLDWAYAGWARFFVPEPVTTVAAVQKLKLFTWAGDADSTELWKEAGFNVVPLPATEIMMGLQTGLINAFDTVPVMALATQWFRHTPYMIALNWAPLTGALVVSKRAWDKVPEDLRPALMAEAKKIMARWRADTRRLESEAVEAMKKRGVKVLQPSTSDVEEWDATVKKAYPHIRGRFVPTEYFDEIVQIVGTFREASQRPASATR